MALESHKFDSGLEVYTDHMPGTHTTALNVMVKVGGVDEAEHQGGLSHVVEHCAFNASKMFKSSEERERYEKSHQYFTGANTSLARTLFYARSAHLEPMVRGIGSMVCGPTFDDIETIDELKVVRREAVMSVDDKSAHMYHGTQQALFGSPYSRPVIGYVDTINTFTPEKVRRFYDETYSLGRIAVITAGKATHQEVVEAVGSSFEKSTLARKNSSPRILPAVERYQPDKYVLHDESMASNVRVEIITFATDDLYEKSVDPETALEYTAAHSLIGKNVFKTVRLDRRLSYDGGFFPAKTVHPHTATMRAGATCDHDKVGELIEALDDGVLNSQLVIDSDIDLSINTFKGGQLISLDDVSARCGNITSYVESNLKPWTDKETEARLNSLTVGKVRNAIQHVIDTYGSAEKFIFAKGNSKNLPTFKNLSSKL